MSRPGHGGRSPSKTMRAKLLTVIPHEDLRAIVGVRHLGQNRVGQEYAALAMWDEAVEKAVLASLLRGLAQEAAAE